MTDNRTSQAVESIQFYDEDNLKNPFDIQLKAILAKYKRMENGIQTAKAAFCSTYCDDAFGHRPICIILGEALSFDPLA